MKIKEEKLNFPYCKNHLTTFVMKLFDVQNSKFKPFQIDFELQTVFRRKEINKRKEKNP